MVAPLVVGGLMAGSAILNYLGGQEASKAQKQALKDAAQTMRENRAYFESIGIPPIEAQKLILQQYDLPADFIPLLEEAEQLDPSQLDAIEFDPRFQESRLGALGKLENISEQQGMDIQAQVAMDEALAQARQQEQSQREAVQIGSQRRGVAGGGLDLALQQDAQQNAANQAKKALQQEAAIANQRAMEALMQGTGLAGQLSQEDIALQTSKAQAADAINKFNMMNRQEIEQRNIAEQNRAKLENLRGKEAVAMANIDVQNAQQKANKALIKDKFQQEMAKAGAMAGQGTQQVAQTNRAGDIAAKSASSPYSAGAGTLGAFGSAYMSSALRDKEGEEDAKIKKPGVS